jgi:hypothetical protein
MMALGNFASALALKELQSALGALDAPFSTLPEVKNKDGEPITDVKEKRLALVRQHVQAAGDIINLQEQVSSQAAMAVQAALTAKYKDTIKAALADAGAPPEALAAFDKMAQEHDSCDCENCRKRRALESGAAAAQDEEPVFGFGDLIRRQRKALEEKK